MGGVVKSKVFATIRGSEPYEGKLSPPGPPEFNPRPVVM